MKLDLLLTGISKITQSSFHVEEGIHSFHISVTGNADVRNIRHDEDALPDEYSLISNLQLNNLVVTLDFTKVVNYWYFGREFDPRAFAEQHYSNMLNQSFEVQQFEQVRNYAAILLQNPGKYFLEMNSFTLRALQFKPSPEDRISLIKEHFAEPLQLNDPTFTLQLIPTYQSYMSGQSFLISIYPKLELPPFDFGDI